MIWLVIDNESVQIVGQNVFYNSSKKKHELWGVRASSGKSFLIYESENEGDVTLVRDAIDYAIDTGEKTFVLKSK